MKYNEVNPIGNSKADPLIIPFFGKNQELVFSLVALTIIQANRSKVK